MEALSPKVSKKSKWFSSKNLRLSFKRCSLKSASSLSSPRSPFSNRQLSNREDDLQVVFRRFDGDGDGKISPVELRSYFASIGEYMSNEEATGVIEDHDSDGDRLLDFEDFRKIMKIEGGEDEEEEDLKKAFGMFEMEKGSGLITPKGLQRMFLKLGDPKSMEECSFMIGVFDVDGNGAIDFDEFYQMMAS